MKKRVLLSIHPEFAEAIFQGTKRFEFRRVLFRQDVDEVVVYATAPISRVVGSFKIDGVVADSPTKVWKKTQKYAGVSKQRFDTYFQDKPKAFAIKVTNPIRFENPRLLSHYLASNVAPQSFCYI
jgi:predicted transcriptional regulator